MKKREENLVKNTVILSLGTFVPKVASFLTVPILTGCLSKADYGTYDLILVIVSLLLPAATLQIQTAAFRYLIEARNDEERQKRIISNIYLFILAVSIVVLFVMYFVWNGVEADTKIFVILYFFVDIINSASLQVARGIGDNLAYSLGAIACAVGKVILTVLCIYFFSGGLNAAIFVLIVATILSTIIVMWKAKIYKLFDVSYFSFKTLKDLISYSWPMVPNSMSIWVMNLSDRLVVTAVLGVETNAVYAVANKIPQILSLAQSTFTMAWQENASLSAEDSDVASYYTKMFETIFDFMFGFLALIIGCTPIIFALLIQGDYDEAYLQMPLLFMGVLFSVISSFLGGIYVAFRKTKSVGITTIIAAGVNFVVDIALISTIGLYAASFSTMVGYLALMIFRMVNIRKYVDIKYNYKKLLMNIVMMLVMCVLCYEGILYLNIINFFLGIVIFLILNRSLVKEFITQVQGRLFKKK